MWQFVMAVVRAVFAQYCGTKVQVQVASVLLELWQFLNSSTFPVFRSFCNFTKCIILLTISRNAVLIN